MAKQVSNATPALSTTGPNGGPTRFIVPTSHCAGCCRAKIPAVTSPAPAPAIRDAMTLTTAWMIARSPAPTSQQSSHTCEGAVHVDCGQFGIRVDCVGNRSVS